MEKEEQKLSAALEDMANIAKANGLTFMIVAALEGDKKTLVETEMGSEKSKFTRQLLGVALTSIRYGQEIISRGVDINIGEPQEVQRD